MKRKTLLFLVLSLFIIMGIGLYSSGSFESLKGTFPGVSGGGLDLALASSPTGSNVYVKGTDGATFVGLTFTCNAPLDCMVSDVTLQAYYDDEGDHNDFDSTPDSSDHDTGLTAIISGVSLVDSAGAEIGTAAALDSSTFSVAFEELGWMIPSGGTEVLYVQSDITASAYANDDGENIAFAVDPSDDVVAEDSNGDALTVNGAVINATQAVYVTIVKNGSLTVSVSSSTPREDIVIAGSTDVLVSAFEFTSTLEAFEVTRLAINNLQSGILASKLGDYDNNISSIKISYLDDDGNTQEDVTSLVSGTANFLGLDLYVPKDDSAELLVYATLNPIASSGTSATAGEFVGFNLAFSSNFEAIGYESGETFKAERMDASVDPATDLDFGVLSYEGGSFRMDSAQDVSLMLGGVSTLVVDDGLGDNSNKLPVGTVLCVDDNNNKKCAKEDIYIVSAWSSLTTGTEDSVSVRPVDDAGDDNYDDNDLVLYSLPGKGYFTGTNPMHVYESKPSFALSSTSPSGSRPVSASDAAFIFSITADSKEKVILNKLVIDAASDADFSEDTSLTAYLKDSGVTTVATGTFSYADASNAEITFLMPTSPAVEIAKGTTKTFTLELNTVSFLDDDAGVDDPLTFSIDYGSASNGVVSPGGVTWSDTNVTVRWIGYQASSTLMSNTVMY